MELYKNIRKYRKALNLSQEELAKKVGYTDRSSIAKIENGDVDLPQSKIMLIARALEVDPGTLMGNDGVNEAIILSPLEQEHLIKYRQLDDKGKHAVDAMVTLELSRIDNAKKENPSSAVS